VALQQPVLAHQPLNALAIDRPAKVAGDQGGPGADGSPGG